jgi:hypothetical protein
MNVFIHFSNFCSGKAVNFIIFVLNVILAEKVCLDVVVIKTNKLVGIRVLCFQMEMNMVQLFSIGPAQKLFIVMIKLSDVHFFM